MFIIFTQKTLHAWYIPVFKLHGGIWGSPIFGEWECTVAYTSKRIQQCTKYTINTFQLIQRIFLPRTTKKQEQ